MRKDTHDSRIFVRANDALIARAKAKAKSEGMTLSEFVRQALRREVKEVA